MPLILHATLVYTSSALPIFVVFSLTPGTLHTYNLRERYAYVLPRVFPCKFTLLIRLAAREDYTAKNCTFEGKLCTLPVVINFIDEVNKIPYHGIYFVSLP